MQHGQTSQPDGPKAVFERLKQSVLDYDMNGQADLYAVDGVLEWPFAPPGLPRRVEGREAIRRLLATLGERAGAAGRQSREYDSVVIHETTDPDTIVVELDVRGESASGKLFRLSYIQVLTVRDGQIASFRDYWNPLELMALLDPDDAATDKAATTA